MRSLSVHRPEHRRSDSDFLGPLRSHITLANVVGVTGAIVAFGLLIALPSQPQPWNIRLPLYLIVTIWTMLRPRTALYLLPLAVPWGSIDSISIGSANVNSADILVGLLAAAWLMSFVLPAAGYAMVTIPGPRDRGRQSVPWYLVLAILLLLFTMVLSVFVATSLSDSLKEIVKWLEFLVIVLLGTQYIRTRRQVWIIVAMLLLGAVSQAMFSYAQEYLNIGPLSFIRANSLRVSGTFGQPNPFAGYINIILSIALALTLLGRNWKTRFLAGAALLPLAGAEYLTQSKGGWLAMSIAAIFILIMGATYMRAFKPVLFAGMLGIIGLLFANGLLLANVIPIKIFSPILDFVGVTNLNLGEPTPQNYATAERVAHWIAGIRMFLAHPWTGVGIGNYQDAYPHYYMTIFITPLGHAHNYYINIAAEMGIIGLLIYLFFLLALFIAGARAYSMISKKYNQARAAVKTSLQTPPAGILNRLWVMLNLFNMSYPQSGIAETLGQFTNDRALAIGIIAAFISISAHNMVDNLYVHSMTSLMALLLAVIIRLKDVAPASSSSGGL
ncbi:MAG: O-antigen ligase family protein [Ktedonobacteraceae bacterium]|nr:O-antigen ligase family protein [Chloroflexota bacterium]